MTAWTATPRRGTTDRRRPLHYRGAHGLREASAGTAARSASTGSAAASCSSWPLLLVFGIGKLLGGTGQRSRRPGDQASTTASAQQDAGASTSARTPLGPVAPSVQPAAPRRQAGAAAAADRRVRGRRGERAAVGAAAPGRRRADHDPAAASQGIQPACTFKVSPESLVVKITSGNDRIWSSQDCPRLDQARRRRRAQRRARPYVDVVWSGRRSDDDCSRTARLGDAGLLPRVRRGARLDADRRPVRGDHAAPTDWSPRPPSRSRAKATDASRPPRPAEGHADRRAAKRPRQGLEVRRRQRRRVAC